MTSNIKLLFGTVTILTLTLVISIHSVFAQAPVAQFTSNFTADCSPFTVNFTDQSTNNPISWHWDFGNGNTSSDKNPSAVYKNPGTYTVTLSVSNIDGGDVEKKTNYITVFQNPSSNYTSDFISGCNPLPVKFTDKSTNGSGTINSWSWDVGDGTLYSSQNPKHTYTGSGSYNVSLTVKDNNGCQSKFFIEDYIKVSIPPITNFTGNPLSSCTSNLNSTFTNITTQGSDPITNWHWNFGDGVTSALQNPAHTYTNFGSYDVMLVAVDQNNCSDTIKFTKYVNLSNFVTDFDTATTIVCPDLSVSFSDKSSETPATLFWDFGDGITSTSKPSVVYTYKTSGSFDVKLIAVDPYGCKDSIIKPDLIVFNRVKAAYSVDSTRNCELPFPVKYTNSSSGQNPLLFEWRSDIGSLIDNNKDFSFTYNVEGVYYPSLKLIDGNGCSDSLNIFQKDDSIVIKKPVVDFTSNVTAGCTTLAVGFFDISQSQVGDINQWVWNFGDPASGASNASTLQFPSHSYATDGKYSISLSITNALGCTESVSKTDFIAVGYEPDTVWFSKLDDTVCHGQTVQFYDSSQTKITQWLWMFTDQLTENAKDAMHKFQDTGWVNVILLAGYNGCLEMSETDSVYVLPPKPDFSGLPIMPCNPPYEVEFTDKSRLPDSWLWKIFDDADTVIITSTDTNPVVSLPGPGFYDVELVVTNPNGCTDSIKRGSYIQITGLKSNFGVDTSIQALENCYSLKVAFTDSSTSNFAIHYWQWFFGDGTDTLISRFDQSFTGITIPAPHLYSDTGKYDVTLTVTDASGCSRSFTRDNYVTVHGSFANFISDTVTFCVPYMVNFADISSTTNTVVDWDWDFGDGNIDTTNTPYPSNSYTVRGIYDVKLSVKDAEGCKNDATITKYITGTFPYPSFTFKSNKKGCIAEEVEFTSTSSGTGLIYTWNWSDNSNEDTSRSSAISHAWDKDSTYFFTLTVIDTNGCDSAITDSIIIVPDPIARIGIDSIFVDCPPLPVNFSDSSFTSSDDQITSWYWKFEKGKVSTAQHPSYTYLKADTFDVFLAVQTLVGCKDTLLLLDTIIVGGPNGAFVMSPLQCCVPCTATFIVATKNNFTQIWDFGDGNSDTIADTDSLIWIYKSAANPHPLLLLDDGQGCNELIADEPTPDSIIIADPVAGFFMDKNFLCDYDTVSFADTSSTNNPSIGITGWKWLFGDGDSSSAQFPTHFFGDTGKYTITLFIENELNKCVASASEIIEVNSKPKVQMSIGGFEGCIPFEIQFGDSSQAKVPITYRQWEYGDGTSFDNTQNPKHMYTKSGSYVPKLILYYADSACAAWATSGKVIKAFDTPEADFDIDSSITNFKTLDIFFKNSSNITSNVSYTYFWDFGDPLNISENTSAFESPMHSYFDIGDYIITMVISNDACSDTVLKPYYLDNSEFSAPNVFTPKPSSPGVNDVFFITGVPKESHLLIFDRWGKKVYDADNYINNWDGGTLPADTYFYILTNDRKNKSWKGFVRLIRE